MGRMLCFREPTEQQVISKVHRLAIRRPSALKVINRLLDHLCPADACQATGTEGAPRGALARATLLRR